MSVFIPEAQNQAASVGLSLFRRVEEYFQDKQHRREFEAWYLETYGQKYVWKK